MKLKLIQNEVGQFNMLGSERSLAFSYGIAGDDGRIIERDGVKCRIEVKADEDDAENMSDMLREYANNGDVDQIIYYAVESTKSIWGSTDYAGERQAFAEQYLENFDELKRNFEADRTSLLEKQITQLQDELASVKLPEATWEMAEVLKANFDKLMRDVENYRKWASEYKEETDKYKDYVAKADVAEKKARKILKSYKAYVKALEAKEA